MKISVIFTGGTIGSSVGESGYIAPDPACRYQLLDWYYASHRRDMEEYGIDFRISEPYRILSENLAPKYLNLLIRTVREVLREAEIDGVIITHGTDTLQYTAAALGYVFGNMGVPIVLVSSDYPIQYEKANGRDNFAAAVRLICERYESGVVVSYRNRGEDVTFHRGTRLLPHENYSADLKSLGNSYLGRLQDGKFIRNTSDLHRKKDDIRQEMCYNTIDEITGIDPFFCEKDGRILWIHPYVGMRYPDLPDSCSAILLNTYHSGTLAVNEQLKRFVKAAAERKIPAFLYGLPGEEHTYETVAAYETAGIHVLKPISGIAAYCKLCLASAVSEKTVQVMDTCIAADSLRQEMLRTTDFQ